MDSSRRAVESYWRSRMIDGATSDEDKVTPVYKLEEICELLRSSHASIVKEVSEFVLKRLEHKSPIVKQKALRLIKYTVGKSGSEFRREMQKHSVAVRQLIHYKGQPDPLKGDALNKAVRETAQEALSAIFSTEDNKPSPSENLSKRIQGFGNTNYEMPAEDKKSFLSEVVGLGSATIKQGLSNLTQSQSFKKDDTGNYKSPNLHRSLTREIDYSDRYEGVGNHGETNNNSQHLKNVTGGTWGQDMRITQTETSNGNSASNYVGSKTREERLLETIVTSGGVRLQPTRDALQVFLVGASKLDAVALTRALESKLQSHLWQVRMKAVCVLEAILRKTDDEHLSIVSSYFTENKDVVVKCSESPQASLREKANKVLSLLGGESGSAVGQQEIQVKASVVQMPDLIDAGDPDYVCGKEDSSQTHDGQKHGDLMSSTTGGIDDLFGGTVDTGLSTREQKNDDDPFADVSFHSNNEKEHVTDLFSGMNVDNPGVSQIQLATQKTGPELFDIFGSNSELLPDKGNKDKDVHDLMADLSVKGDDLLVKQNGKSSGAAPGTLFSDSSRNTGHQVSNDLLNNILSSQGAGMNVNPMFPMGPSAYNLPSGMMFNPAFASQPINYGAMGSLFAQQQFLATMSNFQQLGHLQSQNSGVNHAAGTAGEYSSPLPDIFNPSIATQTPSSLMNNSKKEDTKAFDFISEHLAAARDPKRVI